MQRHHSSAGLGNVLQITAGSESQMLKDVFTQWYILNKFSVFVLKYKLQNCKSQQGYRDAQGRVLPDFLRKDPVIISASWHLAAKNKPYHEKLEGNVLVFIFTIVQCQSLWLDYVQYYELYSRLDTTATAANNNGQEIKIWRSKVQLNSDKTSCLQGTAVLVLTLVFMSYWW